MKKVGILTFHPAHNYGAVLQAYALQEHLKLKGLDVEIIDYRPGFLTEPYIVSPKLHRLDRRMRLITPAVWGIQVWDNCKKLLSWIGRKERAKRRYNAFKEFIEHDLNISAKTYRAAFEFDDNYDYYIMGSDQIWNAKLTHGIDNLYFGDFKTRPGALKIAYAASMAHVELDEQAKREIANKLNNFEAISVREQSLKNMFQPLTKKDIEVVLDPTLLADKSIYDRFRKSTELGDYVLVYTLGRRADALTLAERLAGQRGCRVIELTEVVYGPWKECCRDCASPNEFVSLFAGAKFVVTSSFHGTAFSIIFNRPFYSLSKGQSSDTRQLSLLEKLGLQSRFVGEIDGVQWSDVEYRSVNNKLDKLRESSSAFLSSNIKSSTDDI